MKKRQRDFYSWRSWSFWDSQVNTLEHSVSYSPDKKKDAFLRFQFLILWLGELIAIC